MKYTINKSQKDKDEDKKRKLMMIGAAILAGLVVIFAMYKVYKHIQHPNTYEELAPLMKDAMKFEEDMAETSMAYEPIEDQVGEDVYFGSLEQDYVSSVEKQEEVLAEIERQERGVRELGGATSYEDLQEYRIKPEDEMVARQYEEQYGPR